MTRATGGSAKTCFLPNGKAMDPDDATIEMGALGPGQIPYSELNQRQRVVRDYVVARKMERKKTVSAHRAPPQGSARGQGWSPRGKGGGRKRGGGKGVYEHPHARGRGRGADGKAPEEGLTPEQRRQEAMRTNRSNLLGDEYDDEEGDEDGQDERVEQERTDAQANPGADELMIQQLVEAGELMKATKTPMPGVAGGGGGSESDEPDPKRNRQTEAAQSMEEVEREAGMETALPSKEPAREVVNEVRITGTSGWKGGGFLAR